MSDNCWRELDENGVWKNKEESRKVYHDGVIYAWGAGHLHEVYERETPHDVIISSETLPLVDIDYREDLPDDIDVLWNIAMNKKETHQEQS